jgi:ubiquinone biosynthesis protein COQ9
METAGVAASRSASASSSRSRTDRAHVGGKESVARGLAMLRCRSTPLALQLLYRTVDAIWYAAGDTSTDFNFYTKRATLAGVYSSTLLYWLNDRSEGSEATWSFLDRPHRRRHALREVEGRARARGPGSALARKAVRLTER